MRENKRKNAVIFDLDGTLADTLSSIWYCANSALERFGFAPYERDRYRYFVGEGSAVLIRRALTEDGDLELEYYDRVKGAYDEVFTEYCTYRTKPYEGIPELLQELKERDVRMAVLSNKPHPCTVKVIHTLFGKDMFDHIQGQTPELKRKPDPEGVYTIMKKWSCAPGSLLYVGDTATDMRTAEAAGVFSAGVLWGFRDRSELAESHACAIAEHPRDLLSFIKEK